MKQEDLELYSFSPTSVLSGYFDDLAERHGEEYRPVDPSNPIFHLYEMNAQLHVDSNRRLYDTDKRHYAVMGLTEADLYAGMVGVDYLNRFATPGSSTLVIQLPVDEILKHAVEDQDRNLKRLVIGRHSTFHRDGYYFSLHYPIEIRVLPSGGIQVVWDIETQNALQTRTTNQVDAMRFTLPGENVEILEISVPIDQFRRDATVVEVGTSGFNQRFPIADQLYHVEVKQRRGDVWYPLETTYNALTYDPATPTAVLKRIEKELLVYIPQIYFETGQIASPVRVDVLSTLGKQDVDLLTGGVFTYEWRDFDDTDRDPAQVAMRNLNGVQVVAVANLRGGTEQKSLSELRKRKLDNAKVRAQPISDNELDTVATDLGYKVSLVKDALADRHYLLSRELPAPAPVVRGDADYALTSVKAAVVTTAYTVDQWRALEHVVYEGDLLTVSSAQPWLLNSGLVPVSNSALEDAQRDLPTWVAWLNEHNLVYSPYYYSFDTSDQYFKTKVYNMDTPKISGHRFLKENTKSNLMISSGEVRVNRTSAGYEVLVSTRRSDNLKALPPSAVSCQFVTTPALSSRPVAIKGEYVGTDGEELVYRLNLPTQLLIKLNDTIALDGFTDGVTSETRHEVTLTQPFTLYWVVDDGQNASAFDSELHRHLHGTQWVALTKEAIDVRFGEHLPHVYCNYRRVTAEPQYQLYEQDVLAYYDQDVPARDPVTKLPKGTWTNGKWVPEWEHQKGDPVLDADGNHKVLYHAGVDIVYEDGEPVILNHGDTGVVFDVLVLEGGYKSINATTTAAYYQSVLRTLLAYVSEDLPKLKPKLLPNTRASFAPVNTLGKVPVSVVTGEQFNIDSAQRLDLTIYLTQTAYRDLALRKSLGHAIHLAVYECLKVRDVNLTDIQEAVQATSVDIVAVGVGRLGGEYEALQVLGDRNSLTLAKEYFINEQGQQDIRDVLNLSWVDHKQ